MSERAVESLEREAAHRGGEGLPLSRSPVVMTGASAITCLGLDRKTTWQNVRAGRCGMGPLTALEQPLPPGKDGGQAPELPADESPDQPREVRYLRRAIIDALRDARLLGEGLSALPYPPDRCGLMLGTTLHGMRAAGDYLRSQSTGALGRFLAASTVKAAAAGLGIEGFAVTTCSACSSSLGAVALALTLLREGKLDLVLAGGYDPISEYVYAGFNSLRLVSPTPLRPFARDRQGMKLAEGYAIVALERQADAVRRSAPLVASILGFGESADAHHLTQPHPKGEGAARAVGQALASSRRTPQEIGLIVAHATGTPDNDAGEYAALRQVFGPVLPDVPVVGFKSHVGHTLGGAGAVELVLAASAMNEGTVPPCANVTPADVDFEGLTIASGGSRPADIHATLSTSLGFGGANTCVVLGRSQNGSLAADSRNGASSGTSGRPAAAVPGKAGDAQDVFISGVGVVLPNAIGNDAFLRLLETPGPEAPTSDAGAIPDEAFTHLLNARRVRRMSQYVKLMLAAAAISFQDAGVTDIPAFCADCAAVLGSAHGGTDYSQQYYRQVVEQGYAAANPMLFGEGVPNAGAAHVSLMMSIKGACQTIIGSRTAGLDALGLAAMRVRQGVWDRALVGAGEEYGSIVTETYRQCLFNSDDAPFYTGPGAVALVLESRRSLEARGGRPRAAVETASFFAASADPARHGARMLRELGDLSELITLPTGSAIDRIPREAVRIAYEGQTNRPAVTSFYGKVTECFSAGALAAVAAAALRGGLSAETSGASAGSSAGRVVGVLTTDVTGSGSAARIRKLSA